MSNFITFSITCIYFHCYAALGYELYSVFCVMSCFFGYPGHILNILATKTVNGQLVFLFCARFFIKKQDLDVVLNCGS